MKPDGAFMASNSRAFTKHGFLTVLPNANYGSNFPGWNERFSLTPISSGTGDHPSMKPIGAV